MFGFNFYTALFWIFLQEGFSCYADRLVMRLTRDVLAQESQSERQVDVAGALSSSVVPLAAAGVLGAAVLAVFAMKNVFS